MSGQHERDSFEAETQTLPVAGYLPAHDPAVHGQAYAVKEEGRDTAAPAGDGEDSGPAVPDEQAPAGPADSPDVTLDKPWPVWDHLGGIGFQPCTGCGQVYTDGDAGTEDCCLLRLWRSALDAGWRDTWLRGVLCPDCREKRDEADAANAIAWDDTIGTDTYEQRLAAQVAALADIDAGIRQVHDRNNASNSAAGHAIRLRLDDCREHYAAREAAA